MSTREAVGRQALVHLRALLAIDTTNPPGDERPAAEYLAGVLREAGLEPLLVEAAPRRTNLIARLAAREPAAGGPLLLTAHLDVVPAGAAAWRHPPFGGELADGWVWGRGAVDMKAMAAMSAAVMVQLARGPAPLSRDVIFAAVADEETGCALGSRFLVEAHADRVRAEYALGEVGGFTMHAGGRRLYPVQVAEKGLCRLKLRARGTAGHASMPRPDNALVVLAEALVRLGRARLPAHVTPPVRRFLRALMATQPLPARAVLAGLLDPRTAGLVLDRLLPDRDLARQLAAVLHNTATPTVARAGAAENVVPAFAEAVLDGRTLPGQTSDDLAREVRERVGPAIGVEIGESLPPVEASPDTPLFRRIAEVVAERDPGAVVVPALIPGYTDAKFWSRLGTTCYGFTPVRLPPGVRFAELFHGVDERVPVDGLLWGAETLLEVVRRFCS